MKRSQIILLVVFLLLTGLIYAVLAGNKKEVSKTMKPEEKTVYVPIRDVKNKQLSVALESYGQVTPNSEINISFEVQGKLIKGAVRMKPGMKFRKGQLLYRLNKTDVDFALRARKSALSTIIVSALPDIELDFPSERNKWVKFLNGLNPDKRLPEFPEIQTQKEGFFVTTRNILTEYYNLKSQEAQLDKYSYYAPFSGTVISVNAEPGAIASPGMMIARIAKTGEFEVKVPIAMDDLKLYTNKSTAKFKTSDGRIVGSGKIIRVSDVVNQQTQSADVYYSIKANEDERIYNGMFLTATIERQATKEAMTIPRAAYKSGKVSLLVGKKIIQRPANMVGSKPDSVFVTGLKDGEKILLEELESLDSKKEYIGINR